LIRRLVRKLERVRRNREIGGVGQPGHNDFAAGVDSQTARRIEHPASAEQSGKYELIRRDILARIQLGNE
jgi:hypothetical protein